MWNNSLILKVTIWKEMITFFPWLNVNDGMHKVMPKHWNKHYKKLSSSEKGAKNPLNYVSAMVGVNNRVASQVFYLLHPEISSAPGETLSRNLKLLTSKMNNWFSKSSVHQITYQRLYKTITEGHNYLKFIQSCDKK